MLRIIILTLLVTLCGCAANIQGMPQLVGNDNGKHLYSINGFTDWGETSKDTAYSYAEKYSNNYCKTTPNITDFQVTEAWNLAGAKFLRWTAIYTCDRLN